MALLVRVALGVSTRRRRRCSAAPRPNAHSPRTNGRLSSNRPTARPLQPSRGATGDCRRNDARSPPSARSSSACSPSIAAVTCTFGNLAAYGQTNIKRLLAYSTIAHAGYMMMAVAAAVQLVGQRTRPARKTRSPHCLFYLVVYVFMNLGAFAIVAFLRNAIGSEEIADYAGLIRSAPVTAVALTTILVSLIGLPPLAGFIGKFAIFHALVVAGGPWMIALLVIAGINTAISLIYYLRVAKVVCIDPEPADRGPVSIGLLPAAYVLVVSLPVLYLRHLPGPRAGSRRASHASNLLM